jgi:putative oxidoreductase
MGYSQTKLIILVIKDLTFYICGSDDYSYIAGHGFRTNLINEPVMEKLQQLFYRIIHVNPDYKSLIPRLVVGLVFLSEGIQKYIMPEVVGVGRFERIGFENYQFLAYFVATFEILCGVLLLLGLVTRLASIPLLIIMATALVSTKFPSRWKMDFGSWLTLPALILP